MTSSPAALLDAVRHARVVLAVIGPDWLTATGSAGRRVEHPDNWTHRELAAAFTAGVRVIPVLTEATTLPAAEALPADMRVLSARQAVRLRVREHDTDLARVIRELVETVAVLAAAAAGVRADTAVVGLSDPAMVRPGVVSSPALSAVIVHPRRGGHGHRELTVTRPGGLLGTIHVVGIDTDAKPTDAADWLSDQWDRLLH
ncbi:MAG TPA: hypothetical protein VFW65_31575 [Pseudonocardiaceae bacterium]|nr:hypothetical protein [Pseudonocardiaceae bacterium]